MIKKFIIPKELSNKILTIGVSKSTKGGMASVLASYDLYIQGMRFIPTWKLSNKITKVTYALLAVIRTLLLLLFDRRIKIIHIHGAAYASFSRKAVFIKLGKILGKIIILHMHAADFKEYFEGHTNKKFIINMLDKCDKLIVLSNSWKEYFSSIGVNEFKIEVLNNIVSPPQYISFKKNDGKINLLFLGEIGFRKGVFDLLKAISSMKYVLQDKIVLRIGGNEVEGDIKQVIKKEGLESFVFYEGWIAGNKKADLLNWSDIFILPSYNEGLPIAILEAMSYSHPIISTKVGGIPEIVHSHINGILIEPGNIDQIKDAIIYFVNNPHKIHEYGVISQNYIKNYYPEAVLHKLTQIYNSVCSN